MYNGLSLLMPLHFVARCSLLLFASALHICTMPMSIAIPFVLCCCQAPSVSPCYGGVFGPTYRTQDPVRAHHRFRPQRGALAPELAQRPIYCWARVSGCPQGDSATSEFLRRVRSGTEQRSRGLLRVALLRHRCSSMYQHLDESHAPRLWIQPVIASLRSGRCRPKFMRGFRALASEWT